MSSAQAAQQDYTQLVLGMYLQGLNQWQKTLQAGSRPEKAVSTPLQFGFSAPEPVRPAPQNFGMQFFRRMVEGQVELCRFFEYRWSAYRALPDAIFGCKSPLDLLPLQASFLKQLVEDYANEGARMMQSYFPAAPRSELARQR